MRGHVMLAFSKMMNIKKGGKIRHHNYNSKVNVNSFILIEGVSIGVYKLLLD